MAKHEPTPGPWEAEPNTGRGAWIKGANGEWSALSCGNTDETAKANARLIAAAPDMLAALRAAFVEVRNPGTYARNGDDIEAVILAAIAKAEGAAQ